MHRLNDKWYRIIGIPLSALMANIIFYYDMNEKHGFSFLKDYLYTVATSLVLWEATRQVIIYQFLTTHSSAATAEISVVTKDKLELLYISCNSHPIFYKSFVLCHIYRIFTSCNYNSSYRITDHIG